MPQRTKRARPRKRSVGPRTKAAYRKSQYAKRAKLAMRSGGVRTGGFIGRELKYHDNGRVNLPLTGGVTYAGTLIDPTTQLCLNGIGQGSGQTQRIGKRIVIHSIQVRGDIYIPAASTIPLEHPVNVHLALFLDKQTNAAIPDPDQVYVNPAGSLLGNTNALRNLEYSSRYTVLAYRRFTMSHDNLWDGTNLSTRGSAATFDIIKKLKLPVQYLDANATIASITDNSLHLMAWTDNGVGGPDPIINYNTRVRFTG